MRKNVSGGFKSHGYRMNRRFLLALLCIVLIGLPSCGSNKTLHGNNPAFNEHYEHAIDSVLKLMTLEEKIALIHGNGKFISAGVPRLGIPELIYTDGPTGIREEMERDTWVPLHLTTDSVTFFPTGTALAATWNKDLILQMGIAIGSEANARGKDILLGPGVNIIRTPLCGRNFEYFTEDPFLNSVIAVSYIKGVQMQDVAACIKHFALNNQEDNRGTINVKVDERALREIYLPAYKAAIDEAGVYTFMGSYNKFRGDWLCENNYLLNEILKKEWGFKGCVISDWGAVHSTLKAALAGLDIEMGSHKSYDDYYFSKALYDSVKLGFVPESVINDKAARVLRVVYNCRLMESSRIQRKANTAEICSTAYDIASESIVLLKNTENLLPLNINSVKSIAVIGDNANRIQASGGFGAGVKSRYEITPFEGLKNKLHDKTEIRFAQGYIEKFTGDTGRYSWHKFPDSIPDPQLIREAVEAALKSDVAIIFAGSNHRVETEALDRRDIKLPFGQEELIKAVSRANPRTIVVIVAGSIYDLTETNKNASAIIYSWFNGSEGGHALADILFGEVNPSGKLPFTIPVKLDDSPAHALNAYSTGSSEVEFKEGILVGYRWFDTKKIEPLFCFGYGLSYSNFKFSNIQTDKKSYNNNNDSITITLELTNDGRLEGKETVQLYLKKIGSKVMRADKELKAFSKISLMPGQKKKVDLKLSVNNFAFYDDQLSKWIVEPGEYKLMVGSSSRDLPLETSIIVE
jgi:beta-glucosidase